MVTRQNVKDFAGWSRVNVNLWAIITVDFPAVDFLAMDFPKMLTSSNRLTLKPILGSWLHLCRAKLKGRVLN